MTQSNVTPSDFQPLRPTGPATRRPREVRDKARKPKANPRTTWPSWTDAFAVTVVEDPDEPRPTAGPDFTPSPLDEAEWMGYALQIAGEPMAELLTTDTSLLLGFAIGQMLGMEERHAAERIEHDRDHCRWLDRIAGDLAAPEPRETDGYSSGYCS